MPACIAACFGAIPSASRSKAIAFSASSRLQLPLLKALESAVLVGQVDGHRISPTGIVPLSELEIKTSFRVRRLSGPRLAGQPVVHSQAFYFALVFALAASAWKRFISAMIFSPASFSSLRSWAIWPGSMRLAWASIRLMKAAISLGEPG